MPPHCNAQPRAALYFALAAVCAFAACYLAVSIVPRAAIPPSGQQEASHPRNSPAEAPQSVEPRPGTAHTIVQGEPLPKTGKTQPGQVEQGISSPLVYCRVAVADVRRGPTETSERVTQTLFGHPLHRKSRRGEWLEIAVLPQQNYPGWIHASLVVPQANVLSFADSRIVVGARVRPAARPDTTDVAPHWPPVLYGGSIVGFVRQKGEWTEVVEVEGRTAWLPSSCLHDPSRPANAAEIGNEIVRHAKQYLDAPYLWGGVTCQGIDCSGLVWVSFYQSGLMLPRDAAPQFAAGQQVDKPAHIGLDCVFFETYKPGASHVGIYLGNDRFLQATRSKGVHIANLGDPYYVKHFLGTARFLPSQPSPVHTSYTGESAPYRRQGKESKAHEP